MALFLIESKLIPGERRRITQMLDRLAAEAKQAGGDIVEAQVSEEAARVIIVLDIGDARGARHAVENAGLDIQLLKAVRLVGQDLQAIKQRKGTANYLVEWNLPAGLSMDAYLKRKAEKTPLYAEVPEVSFERTYVCEDMSKCLCLYASPDEDAVVRARKAVSAPIDAVNKIKNVR
ncbi:hypothetical protein W02_01310 [Nitrospira sp. KM1]|uniref:DUF4242 domain-containing protein n=1 Tax=Nitrospira sp. KM1 TaxID=1936990 RepID=UPI0013A74788|nr:DUF4242 domain-containing protein [Nitrospira sp. KM1]BCA52991.1 hypothetical protein W02_01310 [Nitrospira sp. KM1]